MIRPEITEEFYAEAERYCLQNDLRLERDHLIYNFLGTAVARFRGGAVVNGQKQICIEKLTLETDWDKAKVLQRGR